MAALTLELWTDIHRPCIDGSPHRWSRRWCQHCNLVLPKRKGARSRVLKVFERDGPCCHYCGVITTSETRSIDHKTPLSHGGTNALGNLVIACRPCNFDKGHTAYEVYVTARRRTA